MNIAIIGMSDVARTYALGFVNAGHEVFLAWKLGDEGCVDPILQIMDQVHFCSIEQASAIADLVIIATARNDVREVSYWLGDVRGKVIIDASSNVVTDANSQVSTVCAIKAITGSQHIVKVFHTKGYEQLLKPLFGSEQTRLILAGDSRKAKEITKILAKELEIIHCSDFGGNDAIPLFNSMTACWRGLVTNNNIVKTRRSIKH